MRFFGVVSNGEGFASGVDWGFEVDYVARVEVLGGAIQRKFLEGGELTEEADYAMGAVVAPPDGDALGVEEDLWRAFYVSLRDSLH